MAVWLVTGATGFVGRQVWETLGAAAPEPARFPSAVYAMGRHRPRDCPEDRFVLADLDDPTGLAAAVRRLEPDFVIHTAGRTPPAPDEELYRANFWFTTHLLSALRGPGKPMRVVLLGSAAELGPVPAAHLPVGEDYIGYPFDAYGRSKRLATVAGLGERPPLEVMVARVFNPIGPGQPPTQAFGHFAARLAEPGGDPVVLDVGDLDARRDFIDVRDVAQAMLALASRGRAGRVYHVGTGRSRRVGEGLEFLIEQSGRSVQTRVHPAGQDRRGPSDSIAAIDRIGAETGWAPRIAWEQSLSDLWREARDPQTSRRWQSPVPVPNPAPRLPLTA
jgi:GDP-4-dehydro-6-deoxy-D-mannose reductase